MKITLIGTGNMAYHLGKRFMEKSISIHEIVGRNISHTEGIARMLQSDFTTHFQQVKTDSDIYIIAVSDSAIGEVAAQLSPVISSKLVVHTSGSIPSDILQPYFKNYGSFYPLQTLSKESQPDFDIIPLFYNANTLESEQILKDLGQKIVHNVYQLPDEKRIVLHIGAIFVNNFTNSLFQAAYDILKKEDLPFSILQALLIETVKKVEANEPKTVQTGPARRGDTITLEKHIHYLKRHAPHLVPIYELLSKNIEKMSGGDSQ